MRRVIILGSTGSIGTQALDVIGANRDRFEVVGLSAGTNRAVVAEQAAAFGVEHTAFGEIEAEQLVRSVEADVVLNGITGSVGLGPTLAALEEGRTLALANKESLIVGGELVTSLAAPGQIVPVDSEHSAIAQALLAGSTARCAGSCSRRPADRSGDATAPPSATSLPRRHSRTRPGTWASS